jgi:thiol-disulfide isomerase/thioredoxin
MRKNIFFNVLALLCPKKTGLPNSKIVKARSVQPTDDANDKVNHIYDLQCLSLLSTVSKSEIILQHLKRRSLQWTLVILSFFLASFSCYAQNETIEPLKIGDKLPETILNTSFPVFGNQWKTTDSLKLSQFKGKITLIDFWATWCSTCIYKFPILEQLKHKYKGDLVVVLVDAKNTKDTPSRIEGILNGVKAPYQKTELFTIYNDTLLTKIFPHRYLPHYVWIGKDGTLKLVSSAEMLNTETVNALLYNPLQTPQK